MCERPIPARSARCVEKVRAFLFSADRCTRDGETDGCISIEDPSERKSCIKRCFDEREKKAQQDAKTEQAECESRFVQSGGRTKLACSIPDATPGLDLTGIGRQLQEALAVGDSGKADAARQAADSWFAFQLQQDCTKHCAERGADLLAVARQGPALIQGYKRCMVAADSTPEARKLNAYETDLYCDYLVKAQTRCRAASRCDWVEKFSDQQCSYVSPGVGVCNR
jgi:hypothetical protein